MLKIKCLSLALGLMIYLPGQAQTDCGREEFMEIAEISLYDWVESKSFYFFESKMAIDADGSPRAYHPEDIGLDKLSYAGYEGNWWALATDNDEPNGNPIIQGENDPYPGYYVSMTALGDRRYKNNDPRRYVNSEKIPYIVLPPRVIEVTGAKLGDIAYVYNRKTKRGCFAIFADVGPGDKIGEGSIYLAGQLGIKNNPRNGGQSEGVVYMVFPFSGNGQPRTLNEINELGKKLMEKANGWDFVNHCLPQY
ncbi:MAG: glycoside hydrolase family 75 protein [Microscillaceae bacterium]|jgi:hypothetical protein|nr:glycoside hydrolase family 75 protein [Microscillaceae bacterium]